MDHPPGWISNEEMNQLSPGDPSAVSLSPNTHPPGWISNADMAEIDRKAKGSEANIENVSGQILQGETFGFGDEIEAASKAAESKVGNSLAWLIGSNKYNPNLSMGDIYNKRLSDVRDQNRNFSTAHPWEALGLQGLGALPLAAATGGGSLEAGVSNAAIRGAALGGGYGALYGFGSGEGGAEDRVQNSALSGTLGALTGGALGAVGGGLSALGAAPEEAATQVAAGPSREDMKNALYAKLQGLANEGDIAKWNAGKPLAAKPDFAAIEDSIKNGSLVGPHKEEAYRLLEQFKNDYAERNGTLDSVVKFKQGLTRLFNPNNENQAVSPLYLDPAFQRWGNDTAANVRNSATQSFDAAVPEKAGQLGSAFDDLHNFFSNPPTQPMSAEAPAAPSALDQLGQLYNKIPGGPLKRLGVGALAGATGLHSLPAATLGAGIALAAPPLARTASAVLQSPQAVQAAMGFVDPAIQQKIQSGAPLAPDEQDQLVHAAINANPDQFEPPTLTGLPSEIQSSDGTTKLLDPSDVLQYDSLLPQKHKSSIQVYEARKALRTSGTVLSPSDLPTPPDMHYDAAEPKARTVADGFEKKIPLPDDTNSVGATDMPRDVDHSFLRSKEGFKTTGYVPSDNSGVIGRSGVTVGEGVDVGQMSRGEIAALPVDSTLKGKLFKYAEKSGDDAAGFLRKNPLRLSKAEAQELSDAVSNKSIDQFAGQFNQDSSTPFDSLPREAQTVLASLTQNFGPNWKQKLPSAYQFAVTGQFGALAQFLRSTKWKQPQLVARRQEEAGLLDQLQKQGPGQTVQA